MKALRVLGFNAAIGVAALVWAPGAWAERLPAPVNDSSVWKIHKTHWDAADEAGYSEFVRSIGESNCASLRECLESPANPYRSETDPVLRGDCADMAYILRAYYAWKHGLPFSYQHVMRTADGAREDLRYSTAGNVVAGRRSTVGNKSPIDARQFLSRISGEVSTAMFRTHPEHGGGRKFDDFYPVEISRDAVRPGVIAYDIYGHVGIVYDVLKGGRVLVVASHPDESVTRSTYGPNFMRAKPALGAGLKAWRPIYLDGANFMGEHGFVGGRIQALANEDIKHFSQEQYYGNVPHPSGDWRYGEFYYKNRTLKYYDYVRRKLASPDFSYDPVQELRHEMQTICSAIKSRKAAVDKAFRDKVYLKPHPPRLPHNIYGTFGDWEEYSTPSRDARLKVSFIELRRTMQILVDDLNSGKPGVHYHGDNLPGELMAAFNEEKDACTIYYNRSDKTRTRLNFAHVMERLFELSFDPYACPERRWGAKGAELETCTDDAVKDNWHNALRYLRYQAERTYDVRMDFTLAELKPPMIAPPQEGGLGVEAPADADVRNYIARLNNPLIAGLREPDPYVARPGGQSAPVAGGAAGSGE